MTPCGTCHGSCLGVQQYFKATVAGWIAEIIVVTCMRLQFPEPILQIACWRHKVGMSACRV